MLEVEIHKRLGDFTLEAALRIDSGGSLVLVGESGSGKSTLLRVIAGLIAPDRGRVVLAGRTLADIDAGVNVPARARQVGYVAQDYALFPHLDTFENVAFGLRAHHVAAQERDLRVARTLSAFGMQEFARRHPHELSGGQQQRVALARALVLEPELLLLDEPLAALDVGTRRQIRSELMRSLTGTRCVTVYVTHQPGEALTFGESIAVLEAGRITQHGGREELLRHPRTRYVAEFLGTNLFRAHVRRHDDTGLTRLDVGGSEILAADCADEGPVFAVVDPREIILSAAAPQGSAQNLFRGAVIEVQPEPPRGDRVRVTLGTQPPIVAELTRAAADRLALTPGSEIWASFKATGVRVFP